MKYSLNDTWQLSFTDPADRQIKTVSAAVPGNVEPALQNAGLLGDYMPADRPDATAHLDTVDDWTYTRTFDAPPLKKGWSCELVCEGIDTIADIYLNGEWIYMADDMHMAHRVNIADKLKKTGNELKVVIRSAMLWARQFEGDVFGISREGTQYGGQPYLRKARHEWGWDNAPRLLTAGIYRDIYIESLPPERFTDVYLYTDEVTDSAVSLGVVWDYLTPRQDLTGYTFRITFFSRGKTVYTRCSPIYFVRAAERFTVPRDKVALWWPRGFGEPNLSHVKLEMLYAGRTVAKWESDWGVRTVRMIADDCVTPDNQGEFKLNVNNEDIFVCGTNWKPLDALHSRADAKVEKALDLTYDLNCNLVRIWGGGIYEDTPFFDYCDRHGLLVWQDFMFGCEFPPNDEWYLRQVERETIWIIKKLRNHPSLAVWCGDNEGDECLTWNMPHSQILPSDNLITREVLRRCLLRFDPYRSYVFSSPYASDDNIRDRRNGVIEHFQTEHHFYPDTTMIDQTLRECKSRFIGETGPIFINPMTDSDEIFAREEARARRLWNQPIPEEQRNHMMHQTDSYFCSWRQKGKEMCALWYNRDFSVDEKSDYCQAINIICGEVYKEIIEFCRIDRPNKTGVIWWSLADMWPCLYNYSIIDGNLNPKLPYYWIRESQQLFALMAVRYEYGGEAALYSANNTLSRHTGEYTIVAVDANGRRREVASGRFNEAPNSSRMLQRLPEGDKPELWIIEWTENGETYRNHFVTGSKQCDFKIWRRWLNVLKKNFGIE